MLKRVALFTIAIASLLFGFQNCSLNSTHTGFTVINSSELKTCSDQKLFSVYMTTYYPFVRQPGYCVSCHIENGPGLGKFASADPVFAYQEFERVGRSTFENRLVSTHQQGLGITGPQNQAMIDADKQQWQSAELSAATCGGNSTVLSTEKTIPAAVYTTTPTDGATWPKLTWNLNSDLVIASQAGQIAATISLQIRRMKDSSGNIVGYEFKNPSATITLAGATYHLQGLRLYLNGSQLSTVTTYQALDFFATSATETNMAPNSSFGFIVLTPAAPANTDQLGISFDSVLDANGQTIGSGSPSPGDASGGTVSSGIPAKVTYTQLSSSDPTLGVFQRNCFICHGNQNAQSGLNLQDYSQAQAYVSTILQMMNSTKTPMPPSGLLDANSRLAVQNWANSGTPQ